MTKSEAIEHLKNIAIYSVQDGYTDEARQALDMAIKALEEPERKKGEWIFRETENDRYDDMICLFCKTSYTVDAYRIDDIGFTAEDFNYCPHCGADMRGESDEMQ